MADWFDFKGVRSTDKGVYVMEYPPLTLPEERVETKQALGRSGSYTLLEGDNVYNDIPLSLYCFVEDLSRIDEIATWLRGEGMLVMGKYPDRYYKARASNQIPFSQILRNHEHRSFSAVFRCAPYRYLYPTIAPTVLTNGEIITNPGNIESEPVYTIAGTGVATDTIALTLKQGTTVIFDIVISGLNGSITIDTEFGVAYQTGSNPLVPLTSLVSKDSWPFTIPPGSYTLSWITTGTAVVTEVKMEPRWRYV